jgi:hypothetical protein
MLEVFLLEGLSYSPASRVRVGVSLGCNKGDDAVELLARLSGNREVSANDWRDAVAAAAAELTEQDITGRFCPVRPPAVLDTYHPLWKLSQSNYDAAASTSLLCASGDDDSYGSGRRAQEDAFLDERFHDHPRCDGRPRWHGLLSKGRDGDGKFTIILVNYFC